MNTQVKPSAENGSAVGAPTVVASYPDYRQAEAAVDRLADADFPVQHVSIVGRGVKLVERVTGRMGYGEAALRGALAGGFAGLLIGWLWAVFGWFEPVVARVWLVFDGLWFGAVVGVVIGLLMHALMRGRRDFASVAGLQADEYDVVVDRPVAEEARRLLQGKPEPASAASEPPPAPSQATPAS